MTYFKLLNLYLSKSRKKSIYMAIKIAKIIEIELAKTTVSLSRDSKINSNVLFMSSLILLETKVFPLLKKLSH
jgi:hypothetical protein